jgi:hypothetical protein
MKTRSSRRKTLGGVIKHMRLMLLLRIVVLMESRALEHKYAGGADEAFHIEGSQLGIEVLTVRTSG